MGQDLDDAAKLQACFTGHGGTPEPGCDVADLDSNGDVSQPDFDLFAAYLNGPFYLCP